MIVLFALALAGLTRVVLWVAERREHDRIRDNRSILAALAAYEARRPYDNE